MWIWNSPHERIRIIWFEGELRGDGGGVVEGGGKETEGEMKQSLGSQSFDRSFRARSINTNLYWILLLPSSPSFIPLPLSLSLSLSFLHCMHALSHHRQPVLTLTHTLRAAGVWGRWMLYSHRGKAWLSAFSLPGDERREDGKKKGKEKIYLKTIYKKQSILSIRPAHICLLESPPDPVELLNLKVHPMSHPHQWHAECANREDTQ